MSNTVYLDVRELEHPLPLERALEALKALKKGEKLVMIHHRHPFPLYELATTMGFTYGVNEDEGCVTIEFTR